MRDALLAIASVFFAVVLWLQIQPLYNPDRERELSVPLTIRNMPPGLVAVQPPETVRVIASGTASELEGVDSDDFMAWVDMGAAKAGQQEATISVSGPQRPSISARAARPKFSIQVARQDRATRRVTLETFGVPPQEYLYEDSIVVPDNVTLMGPDTSLVRVDSVRVLLDLSQIQPRSEFPLIVEALDQDGKPVPNLEIEPATVRVSPAVTAAPTIRRALVNPVFSGQLPFGVAVEGYEISPVQVTLTGPSALLSRVTKIDTAPISLSGITSSTTRQAALAIPNGLRVQGSRSVKVTILVRAAPSPVDSGNSPGPSPNPTP